MKGIQLKLSAFTKGKPRAEYFEPLYINPDGLSKDDFIEQCGQFWDEVREFVEDEE